MPCNFVKQDFIKDAFLQNAQRRSKHLFLQNTSVRQSHLFDMSKAGLTLNDLYDTTCMKQNRCSRFCGVYTIIQVVHIEFIKIDFRIHIQPLRIQVK